MSIFAPGTSSLKSTTLPAAFLEACLALNVAEGNRNAANPGIAPKNNIQVSISADEGTAQITATLPAEISVTGTGITYGASDYLGSTYSAFTAGGDVTATSVMDAVVQVASLLAAAEKAIVPTEDQPNNIQVESSSEAGTITVTASIPISVVVGATGNLTVSAVDYL